MASWAEIDRIRKDPGAFKKLAAQLLNDPTYERSDFADGFLENVLHWERDELSTRQGEVLVGLRDEAETHTTYKGLSIRTLIDKCHINRFDLDEGDRQRIEKLKELDRGFVTGSQMGWFKRICKQLGEMEQYM